MYRAESSAATAVLTATRSAGLIGVTNSGVAWRAPTRVGLSKSSRGGSAARSPETRVISSKKKAEYSQWAEPDAPTPAQTIRVQSAARRVASAAARKRSEYAVMENFLTDTPDVYKSVSTRSPAMSPHVALRRFRPLGFHWDEVTVVVAMSLCFNTSDMARPDRHAVAGSITWVRRKLLPEGSRKPESIP